MIRGYSDHAANERTFLAWVRTGIAVIRSRLLSQQRSSVAVPRRPPPARMRGFARQHRIECAVGYRWFACFTVILPILTPVYWDVLRSALF